jgi:hypothetical protein
MKRRPRFVLLALIVAVAGTVSGVLLTTNGSSSRLTRAEADRAVAQVRKTKDGRSELLPRQVGVWRDHVFTGGGPGEQGWVRLRSDAHRVSGGIEVTLLMKEPDFTGNHCGYRWKLLSSRKVLYEGQSGTRAWRACS